MATATKRVSHPIFARAFDHTAWKLEDHGQREHRKKLLEGLAGRVIEVGAGNGLNVGLALSRVVLTGVEERPISRSRTFRLLGTT